MGVVDGERGRVEKWEGEGVGGREAKSRGGREERDGGERGREGVGIGEREGQERNTARSQREMGGKREITMAC